MSAAAFRRVALVTVACCAATVLLAGSGYDLSGAWEYRESDRPTRYDVTIQQNGSEFTGTMRGRGPDQSLASFSGSIKQNRFFMRYGKTVESRGSIYDYTHRGEVFEDGNTVTGIVERPVPGKRGMFAVHSFVMLRK